MAIQFKMTHLNDQLLMVFQIEFLYKMLLSYGLGILAIQHISWAPYNDLHCCQNKFQLGLVHKQHIQCQQIVGKNSLLDSNPSLLRTSRTGRHFSVVLWLLRCEHLPEKNLFWHVESVVKICFLLLDSKAHKMKSKGIAPWIAKCWQSNLQRLRPLVKIWGSRCIEARHSSWALWSTLG